MERLKRWFPIGSMPCFYCGIDSTPLLIFLVSLIGCLILATLCLGVSMVLQGKFKQPESLRYEVFEAEKRE